MYLLAQAYEPVTLETLLRLVPSLGSTGLMVLLVYMLLTGKLILPRELKRMEADRDDWKAIAYRSVTNNEGLKSTAQEAVDTIKIVATSRITENTAGHSERHHG